MEWRAQSRRVTLTSCMDEDECKHADHLSHAMWCAMSEDDDARLNKTNKKTTCTFTCQVSRFMCTVSVLVVTSSVVSDVLSFGFHHAYVIPSFILDVVVRLYLVIVNSDCSHNYCLLHSANTGHLRCCLYIVQALPAGSGCQSIPASHF